MNSSTLTITPRYGEALAWAEAIHRDQCRKGKQVPYISHLISVSALVWEDGGTEDQAIAALLHDAIEDAGQSHASIAERFGEAMADIVRDCTDPCLLSHGQNVWRRYASIAALGFSSSGDQAKGINLLAMLLLLAKRSSAATAMREMKLAPTSKCR